MTRRGPAVVQMSKASAANIERADLSFADIGLVGSRVVLLDGPDGPVELPRVTESELGTKSAPARQKSILASFRRDNSSIMQKCFELDWSMVKKGRLIPEAEEETARQLIEAHYGQIVAIYRHLSACGVSGSSGFGVTSLDAGSFANEAGLVDGQVTRLADVDRLHIASNVVSSEQRKNLMVRYEKVLARFQFLELLLRIADQRFKQTGEFHTMTEAIRRLLPQVEPLALA